MAVFPKPVVGRLTLFPCHQIALEHASAMRRGLGNAGGAGLGGAAADQAARHGHGEELDDADDQQGVAQREGVGDLIGQQQEQPAAGRSGRCRTRTPG